MEVFRENDRNELGLNYRTEWRSKSNHCVVYIDIEEAVDAEAVAEEVEKDEEVEEAVAAESDVESEAESEAEGEAEGEAEE